MVRLVSSLAVILLCLLMSVAGVAFGGLCPEEDTCEGRTKTETETEAKTEGLPSAPVAGSRRAERAGEPAGEVDPPPLPRIASELRPRAWQHGPSQPLRN